MTPLVSVVMPAYNAEKYIAEAIQSILEQTFEDFELIIVNDSSTDETAAIVRSFSDSRIVFIDNKIHARQSAVRNQGLSLAQGKYIAIMDADDISLPERFQMQVNFLENNPSIGILGTAGWEMKGIKVGKKMNRPISHLQCIQQLVINPPFIHSSVMIRKASIPARVQYDENYHTAEDYKFWVELSQSMKMANLKKPLVKYRHHEESVSAVYSQQQEKYAMKIRVEFMQYHLGNDLTSKYQPILRWLANPDIEMRLESISSLYHAMTTKQCRMFNPLFKKIIKHHTNLLKYQLGDKVATKLLMRYFKYKMKTPVKRIICR